MEPMTIAIICAASFGAMVALSTFVRLLLLSHDKKLNDMAQQQALSQEAQELEKMRLHMESSKRFNTHYKVLGSNKDAIVYIDNKIEELLQKKYKLIERYGQVTIKESSTTIDEGVLLERKAACDRLKQEIDKEMEFYDKELAEYQARRGSLWDSHSQLQEHLLDQEKTRNQQLDSIYKRHTSILEKIFLRHIDDSELITKENIKAGTSAFKMMVLAPFQFLLHYFKVSKGISLDQLVKETQDRNAVAEAEQVINGDGDQEEYSDEEAIQASELVV